MKILKIFVLLFLLFGSLDQWFAWINFSVSPIKYELSWDPGWSITKTASLRNNWDLPVTIYTWKSDFETKDYSWAPKFLRYSEIVNFDQTMSSWINIDLPDFSINPWEEKDIEFTINIPENATPWWHYWAVFFKNTNSENSWWEWNIWINVDYWILILLNVSWEIITDIDIEEPVIDDWNVKKRWWSNVWWSDNCLIDFTNSTFDGKCFDNPIEIFENDSLSNNDLNLEEDYLNDINLDILILTIYQKIIKMSQKKKSLK